MWIPMPLFPGGQQHAQTNQYQRRQSRPMKVFGFDKGNGEQDGTHRNEKPVDGHAGEPVGLDQQVPQGKSGGREKTQIEQQDKARIEKASTAGESKNRASRNRATAPVTSW